MIPKIKIIKPLDDFLLLVSFDDGRKVMYDLKEDIATIPDFKALETVCGLWKQAQLDSSRTCIYWNDRIDLPSDTIYEYGKEIESSFMAAEPQVVYNEKCSNMNEPTLNAHNKESLDHSDFLISVNFIQEIKQLVTRGRQEAYAAINQTMLNTYWQIGQRIVEEEQGGAERADYGKQLLKQLSAALTEEFGKGFSVQNLYYFRQFYLTFPEIFHTPCGILTWSHYRRLLSVTNPQARDWYAKEAAEQMWSYATLNRNIATQYYERMLLSQEKEPVEVEMKKLTADFDKDKLEFVKNPVVAEFLGMSPVKAFAESEMENAILINLEKFLLELGKGFSFVERQKLIRTEAKDYFIDLVFYNFKLKCFVLIDLKVGQITHQDVGQMEMYVNMFDQNVREEGDNPTLGIVLCSETDVDIARYMLNDNKNVFMSKYLLYMPTKEELKNEIERQKALFALQQNKE